MSGIRRGKLSPRALAIAALLAIALVLTALLPLKDWSAAFASAVDRMSPAAALAVFCAVNVAATLVLAPAWIFALVAGAVFGFAWGLIAAALGATLSALAAFLVARYLLRSRIERTARKHPTFKAVDQAVAREPFKIVALLRMSPVLPSGLKSYFLGLTRVRLDAYAAASIIGMLAGLFLKVYVGSAGRAALRGGSALDWTIFTAGVAATLALTLIIGRRVRLKLKL